jgi:Short-chain dehydrogenases of various substrate specificities
MIDKKVVIIGASSGIGKQIAINYINSGAKVALAARRQDKLKEIQALNPSNVVCKVIDITQDSAQEDLKQLIDLLGGMDLFVLCSGVGWENITLEYQKESQTVATNALGFTRMVVCAYNYFSKQGYGHIAAIASVAGRRTLYLAPSYCATKCFDIMYLRALDQIAKKTHLNIKITTILPGFIDTDLLKSRQYPLTCSVEKGGRIIFQGIEKSKRRVFAPFYWKYITWLMRIVPDCLLRKII